MDRDRQSQHEELVHRLAALPDQARQREGSHQRDEQGDQDGRDRNDGTVSEIPQHVSGIQGAFVVRPEPVLRKTDDIFTEDLLIVLQGKCKHPVDGEEIDHQPDQESDIDKRSFYFI